MRASCERIFPMRSAPFARRHSNALCCARETGFEFCRDLTEGAVVRFLIPFMLLAVGAQVLCARIATVRTTSGREFVGHVRFTRQGILVVNSAANFVLTVDPTNVTDIFFPQ